MFLFMVDLKTSDSGCTMSNGDIINPLKTKRICFI
jgi:hypothetical protein